MMTNEEKAQALREIAEEKDKRNKVYDEAITTIEEAEANLYHLLTVTFSNLETVSGRVSAELDPEGYEKSSDLYYALSENPAQPKLRAAIDEVRKGIDTLKGFVTDALDV